MGRSNSHIVVGSHSRRAPAMDESFDNTGDAWQSAAEAKMSIEARIESNQRALEVNPNDMGAMMGLAHAYILSENWESA